MLYTNRIVEGYSSCQIDIITYHRPTCWRQWCNVYF